MSSIKGRTALLIASWTALLLALGGFVLFYVVRAALTSQFDEGLASRAAAVQSLVRSDQDKIEMEKASAVLPAFSSGERAEYFVAWVREGDTWRVLQQSDSLVGKPWPEGANPPAIGTANHTLPGGQRGRWLSVEFTPAAETDTDEDTEAHKPSANETVFTTRGSRLMRLVVAQSRVPLDRSLASLATAILATMLTLVAMSIIATRWAVRRGTMPLENLSARVATLGPATLDQRLQTNTLPAELVPIAGRLNDLLARLDDAFARERRFTSAASHELRTPIAELRMLLEVALSRPRNPEHWEQTAHDGLGVLGRAQRLTEALLRLSRAGSNIKTEPPIAACDLAVILREQSARALVASGHDAAHVSIDTPDHLPARVDPALATSIIGNLIDNALRHGDVHADRPVRCVGAADAGGTSLTISNPAPGLTHADITHFFEPFWRKDAARSTNGGYGLGLAVSRALAESIGASLDVQLSADNIVRAMFRIPSP